MGRIAFFKMHGLGNDFVVLDARHEPLAVDAAGARALADRHTGIGCDQVIVLQAPRLPGAQAAMRIFNADGSGAAACGNAARCVAWLIGRERGDDRVRIETDSGLLSAETLADGRVSVDMGRPRTLWHEIPLARAMDTNRVALRAGPLADPVCTSMGNPHATFFVADPDMVDLAALGPVLEQDVLFPERANIGVAAVTDGERLRLRVWERGAGITRACGTGACAALVAACRRGLTGRRATVALDGGDLDIVWREDDAGGTPGHVVMTGPASFVFEGRVEAALLGGM
jgi:diaminopimelate epimerase